MYPLDESSSLSIFLSTHASSLCNDSTTAKQPGPHCPLYPSRSSNFPIKWFPTYANTPCTTFSVREFLFIFPIISISSFLFIFHNPMQMFSPEIGITVQGQYPMSAVLSPGYFTSNIGPSEYVQEGNRRCPKYLSPCHPCEKAGWNLWFLFQHDPVLAIRGKETTDQTSLSIFLFVNRYF